MPNGSVINVLQFHKCFAHAATVVSKMSFSMSAVHGLPLEKATDRDTRGRQMAPPRTPDKKYDADLILSKGSWPTKPGELNVSYSEPVHHLLPNETNIRGFCDPSKFK